MMFDLRRTRGGVEVDVEKKEVWVNNKDKDRWAVMGVCAEIVLLIVVLLKRWYCSTVRYCRWQYGRWQYFLV
jgi:hypothetical protein